MDVLAAILERPYWEIMVGASALIAASVTAALAFFWIGFRIAEVSAIPAFEGMFGLSDSADVGNARVVPREVAARLDEIKTRAKSSAERTSLGGLAAATQLQRIAQVGVPTDANVDEVKKLDD